MAWLTLQVFHPTTNTYLSGIAQVGLYGSCIAPFFWAPVLVRSPKQLERLLWIALLCNGLGATVGILQVYYPERFMPAEFSRMVQEDDGVASLTYIGADGREIVRPPGLFDVPGAACGSGAAAGLLGLLFGSGRVSLWKRTLALALSFIGASVIYLTMVRSAFLILAGTIGVYVAIQAYQGRTSKAAAALLAGAGIIIVALMYAIGVGGDAVQDRFASLVEASPGEVYYRSGRGLVIRESLGGAILDYPLGAGLGRWGMMRAYFGNEGNTSSTFIWTEVQPMAWVVDGGILLMILYGGALWVTMQDEIRIACSRRDSSFTHWATAVCAINAGTIALILSFTPFTTQVGMQFWFLAGVLVGAARLAPVARANSGATRPPPRVPHSR